MFGQFVGREVYCHVCGPERTEPVFLCNKGAPVDHFGAAQTSFQQEAQQQLCWVDEATVSHDGGLVLNADIIYLPVSSERASTHGMR